MGIKVGASKVEDELFADAKNFIEAAEKKGVKLYLPVDFVVADRFAPDAVTINVTLKDMP